jgi:TolB protein
MRGLLRTSRWWWVAGLWVPSLAAAQQQDTSRLPTGVRLGFEYNASGRVRIAFTALQVAGGPGASATADALLARQVENVLRTDADQSDCCVIVAAPAELQDSGVADSAADRAWNGLAVAYVVGAALSRTTSGATLRVEVRDVAYGVDRYQASFALPDASDPDARLALHAVSDAVIRAITGHEGAAATRILFVRGTADGRYQLVRVDADGQDLHVLRTARSLIYSPMWSPDGRRVALAVRDAAGRVELHEMDLVTSGDRVISGAPLVSYTPAYSPDGTRLIFAADGPAETQLYQYDEQRHCCIRRLTDAPSWGDLGPSYSPDGSRIAFNSDRLGQPEIYIMPDTGGTAQLISPYVYGEPGFYTAPDWSPAGNLIAYQGKSRGAFQIMVTDLDQPGQATQLTTQGRNEDPNWAPDGRHLVFVRTDDPAPGLYILDRVTGRLRLLVAGDGLLMPDWSPALERASPVVGPERERRE